MNQRETPSIDEQAVPVAPPGGAPDFDAVRNDFPREQRPLHTSINASSHPLSVHSAAALHRYIDWVAHEVGEPWWPPVGGTARRRETSLRQTYQRPTRGYRLCPQRCRGGEQSAERYAGAPRRRQHRHPRSTLRCVALQLQNAGTGI